MNIKRSNSMKKWHKENKNTNFYKNRNKNISKSLKGRNWISLYGKKKTKELKKLSSIRQTGKKLTEKHKNNISKSMIGNKKLKKSLKKFFREVGISEKTKKKLRKTSSEMWNTEGFRENHRLKMYQNNIHLSKKHKQAISRYMSSENNPAKKIEVKKKMSKKSKEWWKTHRKEIFIKFNTKPNNTETKIISIIKKYKLPFKYVGNSKKWITAIDNRRFNPDFVDETNKRIVEYDGTYWHRNRLDGDKLRNKTYKLNGYDLLIIDEKDFKNNTVANKLINFSK